MREAPRIDRQRIEKGLVIWTSFMLFGLLVVAPLSGALAAPIQGPKGQACKSTGTTTVEGKEEGTGKKMKCTADYCKYDECVFTGTTKVCKEHTHYENVRDCQAALGRRPRVQGVRPPAGTLQKSP